MAIITLAFDTGAEPVSRVHNAFVEVYGYSATILDPANPGQTLPNPETKAQHTKRQVRQFMKGIVKLAETNTARKTAEATVTDINLID